MSCQIIGEITQLIRKSKIGKLRAKNINYPQLRLPPLYSKIIGAVVSVFETEHEEKQAFLIVTEHSVLKEDMVLKPIDEVLKPAELSATEAALRFGIRD